jgi:hypothetical protein
MKTKPSSNDVHKINVLTHRSLPLPVAYVSLDRSVFKHHINITMSLLHLPLRVPYRLHFMWLKFKFIRVSKTPLPLKWKVGLTNYFLLILQLTQIFFYTL